MNKYFFILIIIITLQACDKNTVKNDKLDQFDRSLCEFSKAWCEKEVNGIKLSILIDPNSVPSEKQLNLNLMSNAPLSDLEARIEGRDMFMGMIPLHFESKDKKSFESKFMLGSCASGYMVWRLFVSGKSDGKEFTIFFDFLADQKNNF